MTSLVIKPFEDISRGDALIAGGKGASLGEMTQTGIPVPPGFVILADAFEKFLMETDLNVEIDTILHSVDIEKMHTVEHASETIQKLILEAKMPEDIALAIREKFDILGMEFVAVRSSATAEDSDSAAWAGQLDSFLNTTEETLLKNVQRCWASLFTSRAIFYRFEKELHKQKISVAVVVQKMVESEFSGIAFSVHPVTEDRNQLIIEAGFGLGEAIVSGQVTPDSYVVEKEPRKIIDINISEQSKALYRKEHGGNEWKDLGEKGKEQVLNTQQILELSELIVRIENHYGFPCDIEWAYAEGKFYITQSRPITTLANLDKEVDVDNGIVRILERINTAKEIDIFTDTNDWFVFLERKQSLFLVASFIKPYKDFLFKEIGVGFDKQIHVIRTDNSFYFRSQKECDTIKESLAKFILKKENHTVVKEWFALGKKFNSWADEEIKRYSKISEIDLKDPIQYRNFLNNFYNLLFYSTILPYWAMLAGEYISKTGKDDDKDWANEVIKTFEVLRGDTRYPQVIEGVVSKYWLLLSTVTNLSVLEVQLLLPDEIEGILSARISVRDVKDLSQRENCVLGILPEHDFFFDFSEELMYKLLPENTHERSIVSGVVANHGITSGRVKIVNNISDINKVNSGDVIVSINTSPSVMVALRKAVAIVTDEGGITCHAAIVSRELNIPCIIGTKIATRVFRDGDLVEVDANKGVVKML